MPPVKAAHHRGNYHTDSRRLVAAGRADPHAICWRCGLTLTQHAAHRNGRAPKWTAGHTQRGVPHRAVWWDVRTRPQGATPMLALEASTCNYQDGGAHTPNTRRTGYDWP